MVVSPVPIYNGHHFKCFCFDMAHRVTSFSITSVWNNNTNHFLVVFTRPLAKYDHIFVRFYIVCEDNYYDVELLPPNPPEPNNLLLQSFWL